MTSLPFVIYNDVFDQTFVDGVLAYAIANEDHFVPSTVSTSDTDYRRSSVLYDCGAFRTPFLTKVANLAPTAMSILGMDYVPQGNLELQLTASGDGDYFRIHNDSGSPDTASRLLTYVWYVSKEPQPFTGGQLKIYDMEARDGYWQMKETFHLVEPVTNSLLFFPAYYMHEVLPVAASPYFADSRYTFNGWTRRI